MNPLMDSSPAGSLTVDLITKPIPTIWLRDHPDVGAPTNVPAFYYRVRLVP